MKWNKLGPKHAKAKKHLLVSGAYKEVLAYRVSDTVRATADHGERGSNLIHCST